MDNHETVIEELGDGNLWSGWLHSMEMWANDYVLTSETLIEISLIIVAASIAWPISIFVRKQLQARSQKYAKFDLLRRLWSATGKLAFPILWLGIQWVIVAIMSYLGYRHAALDVTSSLLTAWVIISLATVFVANPFWSLSIAISAWIVAALNIVGLLDRTIALLNGMALNIGQIHFSVLTVLQGLIALAVLLWVTAIAGQIVEGRVKSSPNLSPSMKVLSTKLLRIALAFVAVVLALRIVGVDLTAFAVLGGAIGVGLGFGLQKIFANLVSGFILLLDKSIKPGDVIAIAGYYGRVDSLGARYVSVLTRDGIEHLIPNEELITTRVENWSHSQNLLRIRKTVGIHYKSDVRKAIALCLEAADETPRILKDPAPVCHLQEFADSAVNLEMRFWIDDPMNGRANVVSAMQLSIWDKFHQHGIEIPYPQHDIHFRSSRLTSFTKQNVEEIT
ncbi:MAG: mechanosensitive ion channel domain-containing protein [Lysobacterales bacterium]